MGKFHNSPIWVDYGLRGGGRKKKISRLDEAKEIPEQPPAILFSFFFLPGCFKKKRSDAGKCNLFHSQIRGELIAVDTE